ncbi:MAG TPA: hemolysin III family protein [Chitinophagaceae bacterium]|jgi:hemolysin III
MHRQEMPEKNIPEFTPEQEWANVVIHILGIVFGIIAIPFLISLAAREEDVSRIFSMSIYGLCFLMVFTFSTLYHATKKERPKALCKRFDRISIYFLIAGTYTPIIRYYLYNSTGIILLSVLWGFVILGILFECFFFNRFNIFSVIFYLGMGLIFLFVPKHFFATMPWDIAMLVLTGVVLYCFGVIFYLWHKWKYHHAVWHLFVLIGGICHYTAMLQTVSLT